MTLDYAGIAVFAVAILLAIFTLIRLCCFKRAIVKDESSDQDITKMFPEVEVTQDDGKPLSDSSDSD